MARIRVSGASGSSENTIVFIPAGGHSHDGVTSSLISTEKYSIYDFSPSFVNSTQSQTRAIRQENNRLAFESLVVNIVNQSVLVPAGIRLTPGTLNASAIIANTITAVHLAANTITADEIAANTITTNQIAANTITAGDIAANTITADQIAANTITTNQIAANTITAGDIAANTITADQIASNTITADELVSNVVLVNNIIRSNVYTPGSDGWKISNDGTAEFSNVIVRGNIYSNVGTIGGWILSNTSINSGNTYLYSNGQITNGNFSVSSTGVLTATGANFSGTITGNTTSTADLFIREPTGGRFYLTYMLGDYVQVKRTQSDYSTITGSGAFLGYFNASTVADDATMVVNSTTPVASGTFVQASSSGNLTATGTITAAAFSGNATSASAVPASGITGQTGMWTSAARPGPYRLYRRDDNNDYSVQTYFAGGRWRLYGYNGDTAHADTHVGYADSAGSAGSAGTLSGQYVKFVGAGSSGEAAFWIHDQANGSSTTQAEYTAVLSAAWIAGTTPATTWGVSRDGLKGYIQQYYSGNSYSSRTITGASDRRVKDNIEPISSVIDVLGIIDTIEPKIYDYLHYVTKKLDKNGNVTDEYNDAPKKFGFIAQELQSALGEYGDLVVDEIDDPRYDFKLLTTEDRGIIAIMWEAIRQLKAKIDILEAK